MYHYALTFVSKDRPGIVAEVTKVLYEKGFNIEDSSSTLLQGIFSMIFIVAHNEDIPEEQIAMYFSMKSLPPSVYRISPKDMEADSSGEHYILSVYGADKPGIVHSITEKLAELGVNIIDLQTQIAGIASKGAYIMILEVIPPAGMAEGEWIGTIKETAKDIGTDITVRHLDVFEL